MVVDDKKLTKTLKTTTKAAARKRVSFRKEQEKKRCRKKGERETTGRCWRPGPVERKL
jgi:hypothetical protein